MKSSIIIKNQFIAYHRWEDAPDVVAFLRFTHRHIFKVVSYFNVNHDDRDLEFFMMQKNVQDFLDNNYKEKTFKKSCEIIAKEILKYYEFNGCYKIEVTEDGENGGIVEL